MKTYTKEQLGEILKKHQKWLNGEEGGERADLHGSNLRGSDLRDSDLRASDLRYSNLRGSNLQGSNLRCSNLSGSDLRGSDLRASDLRYSDLRYSNLRGSNLRNSNLDYSCWHLWCGSLDVKVDKRIFAQLAYHLCRVIVDDEECKAAQEALYPIANQFHRVEECGRLPLPEPPEEDK